MFQTELKLYAMNLGLVEGMLGPVDENAMRDAACANGNPPAWIVAHLASACDGALKILGKPTLAPADWAIWAGPGSTPSQWPAVLPSKTEVLTTLRNGHAAVERAIAQGVDEHRLAQPHEVAFFKNTPAKTWGDVVSVLMTNHESLHIGQLSLWRRLKGLPPLF